jgi:hypothetical protein
MGLPLYESHGLGAVDDAACITTVGQTGKVPTLSALKAGDQPTHCAVCHLLRAVNGSVTPSIVAFIVPAAQTADTRLAFDEIIAAEHSVRSSRAPPQIA